MIARSGFGHLLGVYRARQLLKECRLPTAQRKPVHKRAGWGLDNWTAVRIRISQVCKHHPEYTAKQVLKALGPGHSVRIRWIDQIMNECWPALDRRGSRQCYGWTPERRRRQPAIIRKLRPWERATGPAHVKGKPARHETGLYPQRSVKRRPGGQSTPVVQCVKVRFGELEGPNVSDRSWSGRRRISCHTHLEFQRMAKVDDAARIPELAVAEPAGQ